MKTMKNKIYIIAMLLGVWVSVGAQNTLSLEKCREMALSYNKELKKADYQKQEAVFNQKAARTAYLPSLSASANMMFIPGMKGFSIPGGFLPTAESAEAAMNGEFTGDSDVWMPGMGLEMDGLMLAYGGFNLTQPLYVGGKIRNSNKQADLGTEIYNSSYNLKYSEVIEKTDQAYWQLVSIDANLKLAQKYIAMLNELEDQLTDMYNVGLVPASEKLKVSVQKNEAELNLVRAKNALKVAKMYLNQTIGRSLNDDISVADTLSKEVQLISTVNGVSLALNQRDEIKILESQVKLSELDKKIALADYLPQVGVSAAYTAFYVKDFAEDIDFQSNFAGQVSIPIFNWGQSRHKQNAAKLKIKQNMTELSNTNEMINLEVEQLKTQIEEVFQAIIISKKSILEAEESLSETRSSFEVGLNTTADLLEAQTNWQEAQVQLIKNLAQYEVLKTSWLRVIGNLYPRAN